MRKLNRLPSNVLLLFKKSLIRNRLIIKSKAISVLIAVITLAFKSLNSIRLIK